VSSRAILIDSCAAIALAILVVALTGLGVVALIAATVVLVCLLSFVLERVVRRRRRRPHAGDGIEP
jgi:membrane protein implicated in regulation of membrane protease activity